MTYERARGTVNAFVDVTLAVARTEVERGEAPSSDRRPDAYAMLGPTAGER